MGESWFIFCVVMECCELDEMLERIEKEVQTASEVDRILSVICYEP